jgi:hypothetical protein
MRQAASVGTRAFDQKEKTLNPTTDADYAVNLLTLLWNRMPSILTSCRTVPELFQWLHERVERNSRDWHILFPAFQKYCQRLGIKLRPSGRTRKV